MSIQKVSLELPFGASFDRVCCTVCGRAIHSEKDSPGCPHIAFSYIDVVGDFDYVAPHVEKLLNEIREQDDDSDEHPVDLLLGKIESPSMYCLSITSGGMACGPTSSTVIVGIDFCPPS